MFTTKELIAASWKIFKCPGWLAEAALKSAGKSEFELDEAKQLVEKFAAQKVTD